MSAKRVFQMVLVASVVLAVGVSAGPAGTARALPPADAGAVAQQPGPVGATIPYSGRLTDDAGQPVADGAYDLAFALYEAAEGGTALWAETQTGVAVHGGAFTAALGSVSPLPDGAKEGGLWLEVGVRGPGEAEFTLLSPRQQLSAAALLALASPSAGPACAHNHLGEYWEGFTGNMGRGLTMRVTGGSSVGIEVAAGSYGVRASSNGEGVVGEGQSGVVGYGSVYGVVGVGTGPSAPGVFGDSYYGIGVVGVGATYGVSGTVTGASGVGVYGQGPNGVVGVSSRAGWAAVAGVNNGAGGIGVWGATAAITGTAVYGVSQSGVAVRAETSMGGNLIEGWNAAANNRKFYVDFQGNVYADGTYYGAGGVNTTCAPNCADYAETMDADETATSYEPGDVLVVDQEGLISLSSTPYATNVVGVYSTRPAFLARAGDSDNQVPVALVGVVPVKVSAENGPIHPGDLLVASSTPGHAMRASAEPAPGTVIGKALGSLESGAGVIEMLVMLR